VLEIVPAPVFVTVKAKVGTALVLNVAVTFFTASIVTEHVPVPVQPAPLQPVKLEPLAAAAVNTTLVACEKFALQTAPQLIPLGLLETLPAPTFVTVRVNVGTALVLKVAVTFLMAVIVTTQAPVPAQSPVQPAKLEPLAAEAVKVTILPCKKLEVHVEPQSIPARSLEMLPVPVPVPDFVTVSANLGIRLKLAVTVFAASIVTLQVVKSVQAPVQPAKLEPASALAVKITVLF
jgi:hypothetical protein